MENDYKNLLNLLSTDLKQDSNINEILLKLKKLNQ